MADIEVTCPYCERINFRTVPDSWEKIGDTHKKDGEAYMPDLHGKTWRADDYEIEYTCDHCGRRFHMDWDYE